MTKLFYYECASYYKMENGTYEVNLDDCMGTEYTKVLTLEEVKKIWETKVLPSLRKRIENETQEYFINKWNKMIEETEKEIYKNNFQYNIFDYLK